MPNCDLRMAFKIPYVYGFLMKLFRRQIEIIQNHDNKNVRNIGQGEAQHMKCKQLKLGGSHTIALMSQLPE